MGPIARLIMMAMAVAGPGATTGLAQRPPLALPSGDSPVVLEVPYLPQSVLLCGGAAVAMVERWWGRRGVYAEDFAGLVRPALGGILTTDLDSASRARGWDTRAFRGTPELVQGYLRDGVPVVALIPSGRGQYHYVVVLGWGNGRVVFHDPAGAPNETMAEARFLERWNEADRWALAIRPPAATPIPTPPVPAPDLPPAPLPCAPWLDRALDAVAANRLDEAARMLEEAGLACPGEPLVLRERAGVQFKLARYAEASRLAAAYVARAPEDELGWQLLATSRYLAGDSDGALQAWNRIGRPTVDLLRIDGTSRTRFQVLARAISLPDGMRLTAPRMALARRRLSEVPALRGATVSYAPVPGGLVEIRVAVVEQGMVGRAWRLAVAGAIGAVAQQAVNLEVASPTRSGERWAAEWRWEPARPRVAVRLDHPVHLGLPGVLELEEAWDRVRVSRDAARTDVVEDTWRSTRIGLRSWVSGGVRPSIAVGFERWSGNRDYLTTAAGSEFRVGRDRLRISVSGAQATAISAHPSWRRGGARLMWASSLGLGRPAWSARIGLDWASREAPLGSWPVAGGNLSRAIPLRAEPGPRGGLLAGRAAGRTILHGGLTGDRPVRRVGPLVVAVGVFLDGARVASSADRSVPDRLYLDGGFGVRIGLAEGELGVLRVDLARGLLVDRRSALTVGIHRSWPLFPQATR